MAYDHLVTDAGLRIAPVFEVRLRTPELEEALADLATRASDRALSRLLRTLPDGRAHLSTVRAIFQREQDERSIRTALFEPLCARPCAGPWTASLTPDSMLALWRLAGAECRAERDALVRAAGRMPAAPAPLAARQDELCRALADRLDARSTAAAREAATALEGIAGGPELVADRLRIASHVRAASPRLSAWTHHLSRQSTDELRRAFVAATDEAESGGALFLEALAAQLAEPWRILRLVALVVDQPTDAGLAASGFGPLAETLIARAEQALQRLDEYDPALGRAAGQALGLTVRNGVQTLLEFDQWVERSRSGPWGQRLASLRRALALGVEAWLKAAPRALGEALPTRAVNWVQRSGPRTPILARDPDPASAERATSLLAFVSELRLTPASSGFAALRVKITEQLEDQLDAYVEAALQRLHEAGEADRPRLQAYLGAAARLAGVFGGEQAGCIVRRRVAAA